MRCSNCATDAEPDARFCSSCGQPFQTLGDERRVVTVLFADLVGFTTLSERLDPEQVKRVVDVCFQRLVADVHEFGGRVDKIIGDAIVALFGAPLAHEDDAERAVRAALRMHETLAAVSAENDWAVRMRVGINTGEVLVGALRAGGDYTAMGDVVNTASRLQSSAEPGEVAVGETTYAATRSVFTYESRGERIARGREQPVGVWVARAALAPPGHRFRRGSPLIGRDSELELLRHTVELSIRHGRGQIILLLGEAGVGKTRLANEIAPIVLASDPTANVLNGRCVPYGEANPWWPIADAVREACRIEVDDVPDVALRRCLEAVGALIESEGEAAPVVTGLMHVMGYDGPLRGLDPTRARAEAGQALLAYMEAGVRQRPVLIRLADLHWADDHVLELIDNLSEQLARQPFVLVATSRRALLSRWSPKAGRHNTTVLNLDPLDRSAASELLDELLDDSVSGALRDTLLDRSGGNPLYLEELVTLLSERGAGAANAASLADLPDTLRGLIAARIDGLTPGEQHTLEDAAVWGASGPTGALEEIARHTRNEHDAAEIVRSLWLKEILILDEDQWAFRSDLVREVAYARLTKFDRLRRHHGIAAYLDRMVTDRTVDDWFVETLARHFTEAARLSHQLGREHDFPHDIDARALIWLDEAAGRAEQAGAWVLAERLRSDAVELADGDDRREVRLAHLLGRSRARTELWLFDDAHTDATDAEELASDLGDAHAAARATMALGDIASRNGHYADALILLTDALDQFDAVGDLHARAEVLRLTGMAALFHSDNDAALGPISASLDAFRAVGDRRGEAWALQNLAWIAFAAGRVAEAESWLDASGAAFTEIGDSGGLAWALGLLAFVRFFQGRAAEARELAERILRESERRSDRWGQAMMLIVLGAVTLWEGGTAAAIDIGHRAEELFRGLGDALGLEQALTLEGRALVMTGRVQEGLAMLDEAIGMSPTPVRAEDLAASNTFATRLQLGDAEFLHDGVELDHAAAADTASDVLAIHGLALAQQGRGAEAVDLFDSATSRSPGASFATSVRALALAASGRHHEVADLVASVHDTTGATYLDRVYGQIALGLEASSDWREQLDRAVLMLAPTGDELAKATVALARAAVGESTKADDTAALRDDAEQRWTSLGIDPVGWRRLFDAALS